MMNDTTAPVATKKVGRPAVYTGLLLTFIQAVMIAVNAQFPNQGVSKTRLLLTSHGAVRKAREKKFGVNLAAIAASVGCEVPKCRISGVKLVQIGKDLAAEQRITLKRGRPKLVVAS